MKELQEKTLIAKEFALARRPTYVKVDLSAILNNLKILKGLLAKHTGLYVFLSLSPPLSLSPLPFIAILQVLEQAS